ncbi:epithelial cell adhesion molecule-like, partial [Hoplias malabaricus]|uniref:epithelial cell adhesion molecule-like n=1 Tax=Hoplias malabaricus TaxID=27720 RepID=UPI00346376BE
HLSNMTSVSGSLLFLISFVGLSYACTCGSLSWATCDESCKCYASDGEGQRLVLNCTKVVPKCFVKKAEMQQFQHPSSSHPEPTETVLTDRGELHVPECESSGLMNITRCNNTDVCWCVDSAGVRSSDYSDRNFKCEDLVNKNLVLVQLKQTENSQPSGSFQLQSVLATAIHEQHRMDQQLVSKTKVKFRIDALLITLDIINDEGDLSGLAYYMEKYVSVQPLLDDQKFGPTVEGQQLELESVLELYEEEKTPIEGKKRHIVAILVVTSMVILAALAVFFITFLIRTQKRGKYEKAQTSETEDI